MTSDNRVVLVGWLRPDIEFEKAELDKSLKDKLFTVCAQRAINHKRSQSPCELCAAAGKKDECFICVKVKSSEKRSEHELGCADIALRYKDKILLAPDLIYHYVDEHSYKLPSEFIEALINFDIQLDPIGRTQLTLDQVLRPKLMERIKRILGLK